MTEKKYKNGHVLYKNGDEHSGNVFFIISGVVKINIKHHSEIKKYGMGEIVGLENLYNLNDHISTAIVETDSVIISVPINYFREVADNHLSIEIMAKKEETFFKLKTISKK